MLLLRLTSGWCFALPMLLFEDLRPSQVLRASRERAAGLRLGLMGLDRVLGLRNAGPVSSDHQRGHRSRPDSGAAGGRLTGDAGVVDRRGPDALGDHRLGREPARLDDVRVPVDESLSKMGAAVASSTHRLDPSR